MKRAILIFFALSAIATAQTSITVTITVPSAVAPIVDAYRKTLCNAKDAVGNCVAPTYADLKTMVTQVLTDAINGICQTAAQWAIDNNDASLPASAKTAIANKGSAQATIDAAKTATKVVVQ